MFAQNNITIKFTHPGCIQGKYIYILLTLPCDIKNCVFVLSDFEGIVLLTAFMGIGFRIAMEFAYSTESNRLLGKFPLQSMQLNINFLLINQYFDQLN